MEQTNPQASSPQNQPQNVHQNHETSHVSVGEWVIALILMAIPLVNLVMLFVWAFGDSTKPSKANWAKATLIFMAIALVLYLIIFLVIGAAFFGASSGY